MLRARGAGIGAFVLIALCAGCEGGVPKAEVTGTVTLDSTPVDGGAISFRPDEGPTAGSPIKDGKYTAEVPLGKAEVTITWARPTGRKHRAFADGKSPFIEDTKEGIPAKYNQQTTLSIDVKPGKNEKNWELTTK
jgi:hypothetical protein